MASAPFKTIRVMGKRVHVKWNHVFDDVKQWGEYDPNTMTIMVVDSPALDEKKETVLHEAMHAIETASGLNIPEKHIRALASGLFAVLRDNKQFTRWILK